MDKYDYIEIVYRFALFCIFAVASGYVLINSWVASTVQAFDGFVAYIFICIGVIGWLIFNLGVGAYLVWVAKGSFRPKPEIEDEDEEEELDG